MSRPVVAGDLRSLALRLIGTLAVGTVLGRPGRSRPTCSNLHGYFGTTGAGLLVIVRVIREGDNRRGNGANS